MHFVTANTETLKDLLREIRACTACADSLPLGPRPVLAATETARVLVVGQAPGTRVHETGIPWNDPSGDRLRDWLQVDRATFYDTSRFAIVPMGFCYPGRGRSGDLPPRPECARLWRERLLARLPNIHLTLLIGAHAQRWHLRRRARRTLTETVRAYTDYLPDYLVTPHPSPRNTYWLQQNPWFERELLPTLRERVAALVGPGGSPR